MSRSYKRTPGYTCGYGGMYRRFAKRLANKRVRKNNDISNGSSFRKLYESWDICDYRFLYFSRREIEKSIWRLANSGKGISLTNNISFFEERVKKIYKDYMK
jgi:hypothetical protein